MIEAANASTSIYQVLRMSRAAMTHLLILLKGMTVANNASNVITEVKRTPLAAMTHLLNSTKGALRRPITYITTVKHHCTDWNEI